MKIVAMLGVALGLGTACGAHPDIEPDVDRATPALRADSSLASAASGDATPARPAGSRPKTGGFDAAPTGTAVTGGPVVGPPH